MDDRDDAAAEGARMTTAKPAHPLSYFAVVLSQMTATLKDFDMPATAALLERAKAEIEEELARDPEKVGLEAGNRPRRESRR
jgi:hypothetical protein